MALVAVVATLVWAVSAPGSAPASAGSPPSVAAGTVKAVVDASSPGPAVNEDLIGVNHVVPGSGPALESIGTHWARTDVSFEITTGTGPAYDCATGAWDPTYLDSQVALDREAGAAPELIVDYTPPCLAADPPAGVNPNYTPPDIGPDQAKWVALVYQMALHEITVEGVRTFEVWNEPNLGQFWTGGLAGYLTLYQDTAQALEAAAAAAGVTIEVGGPALGDFEDLSTNWIKALAAYVVQHDLPLDFVSWHLYANNPDFGPSDQFPKGICVAPPPVNPPCYNPGLSATLYSHQLHEAEAALGSYPTLHPALWIDEWNINAGEDARIDGPYGAAFVAAVLSRAQKSGIDRMSFFDTADSASDPTQNWGLLRADLSPKPAYLAMQFWHQLAGSLLPVTVKLGAGTPSTVSAVASSSAGGTVGVLVDNFVPYDPSGGYGTSDPTPYDRAVTVKVTGLAAGPYLLDRTLIDGTDDGGSVGTSTVTGPTATVTFTLAGEGVTLLNLTPS